MSMAGYAKLFSRILDSTIWREDDPTRILWITMLAMADGGGVVECTIPGLADRAKITIPQCEAALYKFQEPDKYSWSQEYEGRRLIRVDEGWFLVNHAKYRSMLSEEDRKEKNRVRVERFRQRQALHSITDVTTYQCNDKQKQKQITEAKSEISNSRDIALRAPRKQLTACPDDFSPNENNANNAKRLGVDLAACTEAFREFHLSKGNRFADWNLALNTWLRNEGGFSRPARSSGIPADVRDFEAEREAKRISDFKEKMRLRDAQGQ